LNCRTLAFTAGKSKKSDDRRTGFPPQEYKKVAKILSNKGAYSDLAFFETKELR
jgi:hypothetical protein